MEQSPLTNSPSIHRIQNYLQTQGINTMDQISNWDEYSNAWNGWEFPIIPPHLEDDLANLKGMLHGVAPLSKGNQDSFFVGSLWIIVHNQSCLWVPS